MLKWEQRRFISPQLSLRNRVISTDLGALINIHGDTIHRDLIELNEAENFIRVNGKGPIQLIFIALPQDWKFINGKQKKIIAINRWVSINSKLEN